MRNKGCLAAILVFLVLCVSSGWAIDVHWNDSTGGVWSDTANWNPMVLPDTSDDVHIELGGTYTVTFDINSRVRSLNIGGASGSQTLSVSSSRTLTMDSTSQVSGNGRVELHGGTITGPGDIDVYGTFNWFNGTISDTSQINLHPGSQMGISGPLYKGIEQRVVNNQGTIIWGVSSRIYMYQGVVFNNLNGGICIFNNCF